MSDQPEQEQGGPHERQQVSAAQIAAAAGSAGLEGIDLDALHIPDDLSGWLDGTEGLGETPGQSGQLEVIGAIDPLPGSPYVCTVLPSDDVAIGLPREQALRYAAAVLEVAHRATYYAAALAQAQDVMRRSGPGGRREGDELAHYVVRQLVEDLPELDDAVTAPLAFVPVLQRSGEPAVVVRLNGEPHGWFEVQQVRQHAFNVLDVASWSDLDTAWRNVGAATFGAGEQTGRAMVADLADYHQRRADLREPAPWMPGGSDSDAARPRYVKPVPKVPGPKPGARPAGGKKRR